MPTPIAPRLAYERIPLADPENAYPLWQEAARLCVPEPQAIQQEREDACGTGGCCSNRQDEMPPFPEGESGSRLRAWIAQNEPALAWIDAGIERGRLQFPEFCEPEDFSQGLDLAYTLKHLARARLARIRFNVWQGPFSEAAQDAVRLLRIADMYCNGEGMVVHYLCGVPHRGIATSAIRHLARQPGAAELLPDLLAAVESSLQAPDGAEQALRVDYWRWADLKFQRLPNSGSLETTLDSLLSAYYDNGQSPLDDEPKEDLEDRLAWRRRCLLELLDGHPCPFDKAATLALFHEQLASALDELRSPSRTFWGQRLATVFARAPNWQRELQSLRFPFQLSPGCMLTYVGESADAIARLAELDEITRGRFRQEFQPISPARLASDRRRMRSIRNPLGMLLVQHDRPGCSLRPIKQNRLASLEATKANLAVRLYAERKSKLPASLRELVRERIVDTLPMDPYSGRALCYCRRRGIVWSVGQRNVNRTGNLPHEPHAPGHVLRWDLSVPR